MAQQVTTEELDHLEEMVRLARPVHGSYLGYAADDVGRLVADLREARERMYRAEATLDGIRTRLRVFDEGDR